MVETSPLHIKVLDSGDPHAKRLSVLCVEDNPEDASLLLGMLKNTGILVDQAVHVESLSEARRKVIHTAFDVIFLDLLLPDGKGLETVKQMKMISPDVPIIVVTGLSDESAGAECIRLGVQDYLVKGHCDGELLKRVLRYVIERQRTAHLTQITARLQTEMAVREKTEAAAVNKELEAFSYSVSHDLRAPLRAIKGFSQMLEADLGSRLDDANRDTIRRICEATNRMGQLIDDLLSLSRVACGDLVRATVNLSAQVEKIAGQFKEAQPERRVEFLIAPGLEAQADPRLLLIALENLVNNACKYTQKQPLAKIEFGAMDEGGEKTFYVRDKGAGFDMAYADKLFGAFQRLHEASDFPGTGIGLATVQRIIHRHGGRIWAEGKVNKGAVFYFTLPKSH